MACLLLPSCRHFRRFLNTGSCRELQQTLHSWVIGWRDCHSPDDPSGNKAPPCCPRPQPTCSLSFGVSEPLKEQDLEVQELQGLNISVKGPFSRGVVLRPGLD